MAKKPTGSRATRTSKPNPKPAAGPAEGRSASTRVYTLDVSLLGGPITKEFARKNRKVVRTIQVRGDQTLEQLHDCIYTAFDRDDPHLYEFQMGTGPMDPDGPRYVLPEAADYDFGPPVAGTVDATTLDAMGLEVGRQFGYWFDFGDDWHHQIGVAAIEDGPGEGEYPRVVKRVEASPPQYPDVEDEDA
jgi:hypothetical protein